MINKKTGYTLIELIAVMAITLILGGITITLTYESIKDYMVNIKRCYREDKIDNAMLNIDTICNSNGIIDIESNVYFEIRVAKDIPLTNIVVTVKESIYSEDYKVKIIFLKDKKLMLRTLNYVGGIVTVGNNVILDEVTEFIVVTKGNLIYYEFENLNSKTRIRCIWVRKKELYYLKL